MGMGVHDGGRAMGRPAGMADARFTQQRFRDQSVRQVHELPDGPAALQMALMDRGNAGAVVAAILQAFERFDQDRSDLVIS